MLDLPVRGLEGAVGEDAAVHHELSVRRRVAEVAAVGDDQPVPSSPFPIPLLIQALVHPVPDATADDYVGTLEGVLIVLQVAHRVHHVVRVFAEEVRTLRIHVSSAAADAVNRRIHVGVDVGGRPVALVVRGTRPVAFVYRLVSRLEVLAGTRFVAVAPEEDGRMVLVALDHVHVAPHCREREARVVARRALPVSHAVRLHVRLVHERDAVQVAKVVPVVVLRIVRVAHERAVRALEELHVLLLTFVRTIVPIHRIGLMAVGAAELHLLAVEAVASVDDLAFAEAEERGNAFERRAPLDRRQRQHDLVAIRRFVTPKLRRLDLEGLVALHLDGHTLPVHVKEREFDHGRVTICLPHGRIGARPTQFHFHCHRPVAVVHTLLRRLRTDEEIADVNLRTPHEPHRAEDA